MDRIGIGILSHAHGHANLYCQAMRKLPGVELVATWDDNAERGHRRVAPPQRPHLGPARAPI